MGQITAAITQLLLKFIIVRQQELKLKKTRSNFYDFVLTNLILILSLCLTSSQQL